MGRRLSPRSRRNFVKARSIPTRPIHLGPPEAANIRLKVSGPFPSRVSLSMALWPIRQRKVLGVADMM